MLTCLGLVEDPLTNVQFNKKQTICYHIGVLISCITIGPLWLYHRFFQRINIRLLCLEIMKRLIEENGVPDNFLCVRSLVLLWAYLFPAAFFTSQSLHHFQMLSSREPKIAIEMDNTNIPKINDKPLVRILIRFRTYNLLPQHFSNDLRSDPDLLAFAIASRNTTWIYLARDTTWFHNREIAKQILQIDGTFLKLYPTYQNDWEMVLFAVNENGNALRYATSVMRNDKEIVLAAVKRDGYALEYANRRFRNDREVVMIAIRECGTAWRYASERLKQDRDLLRFAISNSRSYPV